jgi:iron complex outermembrane receptor protein
MVYLRGENLLDEDARRHTSPLKEFAPLPGRSVGAGVRLEF